MSIANDSYAEKHGFAFLPEGGVSSAKGFKASGVHAGFRKNASKPDLALVVADEPCAAAAAFTKNVFCAAPVQFSKSQLAASSGCASYGCMRTVAINSGNANAATGDAGLETCVAEADMVAQAVGCPASEVLVASTGVIGVQLPLKSFEEGLPRAASELSHDGGASAALAIMTTDTRPKECAVSFDGAPFGYEGATFTVGGMAKGSGMIMPNVATMIAVLTSDAPVKEADLYAALRGAVDASFNKVTVDSDTSTNDTCFLLASGKAAPDARIVEGSLAYKEFQAALDALTQMLAREMARDGEGATKLVTVKITGAANDEEADLAARTVANSPLVKTAVFGHDANWGRIAGALGRSGAHFEQQNVSIDIMGIPVCRDGLTVEFSEEEALKRFEEPEIVLEADLGAGTSSTTIWTCDFSYDYVRINGDYRT